MNRAYRILAASVVNLTLVLAGCGSSETTQPTTSSAPASSSGSGTPAATTPSTDRPDRRHHMNQTFWAAIDARDALLAGNLPAAQEAARSLRDHDYASALPADWKPFVGEMQKRAGELAMAPDLETASAELAMLSLSCGNCHWFTDHGPEPLPDPRILEPEPNEEQLYERMTRHAIASEQMWDGLILPSDKAWYQGTVSFTRAPLAAPRQEGMDIAPEMHARIEELRELARKARVANSHTRRAELYGQMLGRCAQCHYTQP